MFTINGWSVMLHAGAPDHTAKHSTLSTWHGQVTVPQDDPLLLCEPLKLNGSYVATHYSDQVQTELYTVPPDDPLSRSSQPPGAYPELICPISSNLISSRLST